MYILSRYMNRSATLLSNVEFKVRKNWDLISDYKIISGRPNFNGLYTMSTDENFDCISIIKRKL